MRRRAFRKMEGQLDSKLVHQCEGISKRRAVRKALSQGKNQTTQQQRANLRSAKQQPQAQSRPAEADASMQEEKAGEQSAADVPAAASSAAAAAASSDSATRMEVDGETEEKEKEVKTEPADTAAASPAAAVTSPASADVQLAAATHAAALPAASPPAPSVVLLPPPPPLQLDLSRLARLPAELADLLRGCSVEQAEHVGFHLIKCVVQHQMLPDRNAAMDELIRIAQENKP